MPQTIRNFGDNIRFQPAAYYVPEREEDVLEILTRHADGHVRAIGALHSWSALPATDGAVIDMRRFRRVYVQRFHDGSAAVTVGAGCRMKRLVRVLDRAGLALPTVGAVLEQAVAGVVATGTHGSGPPSLSHYAESVRFAAYDETGQPRLYDWSEGDELRAARCGLGCLGVVLSITLRCIPRFWLREELDKVADVNDMLGAEADYPLQQAVLAPHAWNWYVYRRSIVEKPDTATRLLAGLHAAWAFLGRDVVFHAIIKALAYPHARAKPTRWIFRNLFDRLVRQASHTDASTRVLTLRHELYRHVEMELLVPRTELERAVRIVSAVTDYAAGLGALPPPDVEKAITRAGTTDPLHALKGRYVHHYPIVVRRVAPDDTLMSMTAGDQHPRYAISLFTYEPNRGGFAAYARLLAETLARECGARAHWGKFFPLNQRDVTPHYPHLEDFAAICRRVDPNGVFRSPFTRRVLGF